MAEYQIKASMNRVPLEESIPLQSPFHVFLEASGFCNFHCFFCPHGANPINIRKGDGEQTMSFELARKCIDDLCKFPQKIKALSFSSNGEPLLNNKLHEIIAYARDAKVADGIDFTTNACLMTRKIADKIIKAGVQRINISIYGLDEEQYFRTTKTRIDFGQFLENLKYLYEIRGICKIAIKITDTAFSDENDKERFFDIFSNLCDMISIEHVVPFWYDIVSETAEETLNIYGETAVLKKICPIPFFSLAVSSSGIISPCCVDWSHNLVFGYVNDQSLFDIWNGVTYRKFFIEQLTNGRHAIIPCRNCRYPDFVAMDNINAFQSELLKQLSLLRN